MDTTHEPLHLIKENKFGTIKHHGHIYKCYLNYCYILLDF
jgi:hypothetical protein